MITGYSRQGSFPLIRFRIKLYIIPEEQWRVERDAEDQAFLNDTVVRRNIDPNVAYERDLDLRMMYLIPFTDRMDELIYEFLNYSL